MSAHVWQGRGIPALIVGLGLAGVLPVQAGDWACDPVAEDLCNQASRAWLSNKRAKAESLALQATQQAPNDSWAHYLLGNYRKNPADAILDYKRALELNPHHWEFARAASAAALKSGDASLALDFAYRSLRMADMAANWVALGRAYAARGDHESASRAFETAVARWPDLSEPLLDYNAYRASRNQGSTTVEQVRASRLESTKRAIYATHAAASAADKAASAQLLEEARAIYDKEGYAKAEPLILKSIERNPESGEAWRLLAHGLTSDYEIQVLLYQKAVALDPSHYDWWNDLAYVSQRAGEHEIAVNAFMKVREFIKPSKLSHEQLLQLARSLEAIARFADATATYEEALGNLIAENYYPEQPLEQYNAFRQRRGLGATTWQQLKDARASAAVAPVVPNPATAVQPATVPASAVAPAVASGSTGAIDPCTSDPFKLAEFNYQLVLLEVGESAFLPFMDATDRLVTSKTGAAVASFLDAIANLRKGAQQARNVPYTFAELENTRQQIIRAGILLDQLAADADRMFESEEALQRFSRSLGNAQAGLAAVVFRCAGK